METILVATDFSPASRNASFFAYELAEALKAKIILFNAYKVPHIPPAFGLSISRYDTMIRVDSRLMDEAEFLDPNRKIIDILCDEGEASDTILHIANENNVDCIIIGMKGMGNKIFGRTATTLALKSNVPVIIVPERKRYTAPKTIVFANAPECNRECKSVAIMNDIIECFGPELFITTIIKNDYDWSGVFGTTPFLKEPSKSGITYESPVNNNITNGLNNCARFHKADMIVMMPHKHTWFETLLNKSETKKMIFKTEIPILIIPTASSEKKINKESFSMEHS
jgi:nucleotide-binding universal stress UspA family protein